MTRGACACVRIRAGHADECTIPAQNHGVSDICALELVKAQYLPLFRNIRSNERDGVEVAAVLHFHDMQPPVHVLHEIVEVDPRLGRNIARESIVEEVHEHRLSTSDISIEIEASRKIIGDLLLGLFRSFAAEQTPEEGC